MPAKETAQDTAAKPGLVFVHRRASGRCRRVEGFLAQVLQRRANHDTFRMYTIEADEHPELVERFQIDTVPTLLVVENKRVTGRLREPHGCRDIEGFLAPWLH
ncbi:MAG: thioredoxin family protein [Actinomycetota bacterium]|nr:thioredoxin family protein [Actinomycetota bacterium]